MKYLISTDNWFYAIDGKQYKAVWGEVVFVEDTFLGLKTNRNSTNWYAQVGSEDNHVIVAGCQIHYAVRCEKKPTVKDVENIHISDGNVKQYKTDAEIYIAE